VTALAVRALFTALALALAYGGWELGMRLSQWTALPELWMIFGPATVFAALTTGERLLALLWRER
jgi:hypothetical protein